MAVSDIGVKIPLSLCEVLEEEYVALHGLLPPDHPGWTFERGHVRDLHGLLARLRDPLDEAAQGLVRRFAPATREMLCTFGTDSGPTEELLRAALAEELNRLLEVADLAAGQAVRSRLPGDLALLADEELAGAALCKRNRLVLEALFPVELERAEQRRLAALYELVHALPSPRSALCFSGGGIRSATFALGVTQGLARHELLDKFDYLSTVSGGGYLGGFLTAWAHRHPRGLDGVARELAGQGAGTLAPEPRPVQHLRSYSNYLSPRLGILSADTWTLGAIYLRNLFLHWLMALPLLVAALLLPRLYVPLIQAPRWFPGWFFGGRERLLLTGLFLLGSGLMAVAIAYIGLERPSGGRRAGTQKRFIACCLVPLIASAAALTIYWAWARALGRDYPPWIFVGMGALLNLVGWSVQAGNALLRGQARRSKLYELAAALATGALGGSLTWVAAHRLFPEPLESLPLYACLAAPAMLAIFLLSETLFTGLVSHWSNDEDREWWARNGAWVLIVIVTWSLVTAVVIVGPVLLIELPALLAPIGGLSGVVTALLAHHAKTAERREQARQGDLAAIVMERVLSLTAPVFVLFVIAAASLGTSWLLARVLATGGRGPMAALLSLKQLLPIPMFADSQPVGLSAVDHLTTVFEAPWSAVFAVLLGVSAFGLAAGLLMNINKFSLHATYRNRLIRAFLGASREKRTPNPFTGFDPDDNLEMHRLRQPLFIDRASLADPAALATALARAEDPLSAFLAGKLSPATRQELARLGDPPRPSQELVELLLADLNRVLEGGVLHTPERFSGVRLTPGTRWLLSRHRPGEEVVLLNRRLLAEAYPQAFAPRPAKPLHVVNIALNLVGGSNLAWQQRKAESFTVTPLHCGSARVGYRFADAYGASETGRTITLGTAAAISGATASPNMGYHSSPAITFLLTLFNARLGWWLGNPGAAGNRTYRLSRPNVAQRPLLAEALGLTNDVNPYIYLSDGGHFENLGLYEMVLRRCRMIVVVDATQDADCTFEDLGNAIRKIRIDLGIPIEFEALPIGQEEKGKYCALGTLRYSCIDAPGRDGAGTDGVLLYLKPAVYGDEPRDVLHYRDAHPRFPHESTSDQWFNESQFESYRMLGSHAIDAICGKGEAVGELTKLIEQGCSHLGVEVPAWLRAKAARDLQQVG